jgi:hypothetical protein
MKSQIASRAVLIGCMLVAASAPLADDTRITLGTGIDYSTGKYGGDQATDITYVPFIAKVEYERWTGKLTVPWVSITGPGNVVGAGEPIILPGETRAQRRTASGLGDIVANLGYGIIDGDNGLYLDAIGKIKFATADETKGLGTGENDYALQADASQTIGAFTALATLGYRFVGDPPGIELRDVWFGTLGAAYRIAAGMSVGAFYDARQSTSPGTPYAREVTAYFAYTPRRGFRAQLYGSRGLADGSADWGVGALLGYAF